MVAFLKQVAQFYWDKAQIDKLCFVFPNKRAGAFFKKYLGELVSASGTPIVSPQCYTMNDFVYGIAGLAPTERDVLLVQLYNCYKKLNPKAESLDDFIFWGGVLLSDFNDVDKYLADPHALFTNVAEFKAIDRTTEYLSDTQREALEHFVDHFKTGGSYKEKFLGIWQLLYPLYSDFNSLLDSKKMSYEGKVYRKVASMLDSISALDLLPDSVKSCSNIVFVGLNALNEYEKRLLKALDKAGIAQFCWDYSSEWIKDPNNKSSFFMQENVNTFRQAFTPDPQGLPSAEFNLLSVPSAIGQAKQLPAILGRLPGVKGVDTAIVLPDETQLLSVLNSIPEDISQLNVTMGYPLSGTELAPLMNELAAMQLRLREKDGHQQFYHKNIWAIASNSLVKTVLTEEEKAEFDKIISEKQYYVGENQFSSPLLHQIFTPALDTAALQEYLMALIDTIAQRLLEHKGMELELDFARAYRLCLVRLGSIEGLDVKPATFVKLLRQLVSGVSVPFHGEPLQGLQIMGPLETRALDFDNVIILNFNEGIFPRHSVSSSFIPPELRKGFGLPTYEFQDAVWAYYFYRLIQRASRVWMLYDSRADVSRSCEPSRYAAQLELDYGVQLKRYVMSAPLSQSAGEPDILKTDEDIKKIKACRFSATTLQNYLACPAKFYYSKVCELKPLDEVAESLDAGMQGTVFHETMQELYGDFGGKVTKAGLRQCLSDPQAIKDRIREKIMAQLHSPELSGRNILFEDIIFRYVLQTLERDIELMDKEHTDHINILGLEKQMKYQIDGFDFVGTIDRLDSLNGAEVRVVDYKTGKVTENDIDITDANASQVVDLLFGSDNAKRPKIALQLYLYDLFAKTLEETKGKRIVNSIYGATGLFMDPVNSVPLSPVFMDLMREKLSQLLSEIADINRPFNRCSDTQTCSYCDFKQICGR